MNGVIGIDEACCWMPILAKTSGSSPMWCARSADALLAIVNDILDISKLEAGKLDVEIIDFDLVSTVESALDLMSGKAREKGIDLGVYIDPSLHKAHVSRRSHPRPPGAAESAGQHGQVLEKRQRLDTGFLAAR